MESESLIDSYRCRSLQKPPRFLRDAETALELGDMGLFRVDFTVSNGYRFSGKVASFFTDNFTDFAAADLEKLSKYPQHLSMH